MQIMRFVLVFIILLIACPLFGETSYQRPELLIDSMVRAGSFSTPFMNHQGSALIKAFYVEMPSLAYVSREQIKLGGVRFNPKNFTAISNYYINQISYFDILEKKERPIPFPKEAILRGISWSPDGKKVAITMEKEFCQELWIIAIPSLQKNQVPGVCLNSILKKEIEWIDSSKMFLPLRTLEQNKKLVLKKSIPQGPVVMESKGVISRNRTYSDLLKDPQDEAYFQKALSSQMAIYNIDKKVKKLVGKPGLFLTAEVSPSKRKILVDQIQRPYSYTVPFYYFATEAQVWDLNGRPIYSFSKVGPFENLPISGVPMGPREIGWIKNEKESLFYVEALDKGDWEVSAPYRDEIIKLEWKEVEKPELKSLMKLKNRFSNIEFVEIPGKLLIQDYERDKEWVTTFLLTQKEGESDTRILFSLSENDDYNNPGAPYKRLNKEGKEVIAYNSNQNAIYFTGEGATEKGNRPFLKRMNLETLQTEEIFRSSDVSYERFENFVFGDFNKFITSYESQRESPRILMYEGSKPKLLYADLNPYDIFSRIKKEIITYKRQDGVLLSGILYYPLNYEIGKKYPAIIQAYPLEYTDASVAGQVRGSQNKYEVPFRMAISYNALRGYVVLDEAQMPIIGHPETKNDSFLEQLVFGAKAAVEALDERGLIDPKKVGVIGHSYGAFMVANLLTHSDLFATGIARSGAYNRTLTPNGFQGERRTFWKAKETYLKMSPFVNVDKIKKPIMLIHGMADNNPGTFTLQSERYFEALKGQGAIAKLVLLPEESHSYAALESVEHVLYETFEWFDLHLKK